MKLPKNYFENLSVAKYRDYLKLLPSMQKENTRIITTLILTFFAMSFFGIFAINPTLSTIVTLKKQLSDSIFVHDALTQKITNLSSLQQQYNALSSDLPNIFAAIPQSAEAPNLMGQIAALSQAAKVQVLSTSISSIQLLGEDISSNKSSYTFSLRIQGPYGALINFIKDLSNIDRIISLESISVSKDSKQTDLGLEIIGRAYFQK